MLIDEIPSQSRVVRKSCLSIRHHQRLMDSPVSFVFFRVRRGPAQKSIVLDSMILGVAALARVR